MGFFFILPCDFPVVLLESFFYCHFFICLYLYDLFVCMVDGFRFVCLSYFHYKNGIRNYFIESTLTKLVFVKCVFMKFYIECIKKNEKLI